MKFLLINRDNALKSPRSIRLIECLEKLYDLKLDSLSFGDPRQSTSRHKIVEALLPSRWEQMKRLFFKVIGKFERAIYRTEDKIFIEELTSSQANVIICQTLDLLPYIFQNLPKAKVIFDAREYYPSQGEDLWKWRFLFQKLYIYLCQTYLPLCSAVVTVSKPISDLYKHHFNVDCMILPSMSLYYDLEPSSIDPKEVRLIHHGSCSPSRKLEKMIDLLSLLDPRFTLTFMLANDNLSYLQELQKYTHNKGLKNRIFFKQPVVFKKIIPTLNEYDIGLYFFMPTSLNLTNCLPNKFFEYIQARLMSIISPSPAMAEYVDKYGLGYIAPSFDISALASQINSLTSSEIMHYKSNAAKAANILNAETATQDFYNLLDTLKLV